MMLTFRVWTFCRDRKDLIGFFFFFFYLEVHSTREWNIQRANIVFLFFPFFFSLSFFFTLRYLQSNIIIPCETVMKESCFQGISYVYHRFILLISRYLGILQYWACNIMDKISIFPYFLNEYSFRSREESKKNLFFKDFYKYICHV